MYNFSNFFGWLCIVEYKLCLYFEGYGVIDFVDIKDLM